ncbi:Preprotein translocase subunit SecE [uncultured Alphaproteobacteria bacterium]|uniref:Protein translocase subunit SecE n=1 Tax=uncultured Alphaproteobacteria bacterium TaxID=91750 RepID=A0A212KMH3_9PROT|nr:Preprotein translocase subunit SecE [uncultured Alphaproteobacteria bacterium]
MAKTSPGQFVRQVRQELAKVVWPTRKETMLSTVMVMSMAVVASIFLFLVDTVFSLGIQTVLGIGG